ncbi:DUF3861 domain-containing protein [Flavobacterium kingsejongi]|uniref:DUF3861 domain-containing protein n=1 Tax=Flavobacterium kingsejongi TaxID=1678728 RepID=A0A2S1LSQ7_9FLAO|nr:DUF3861 domain-containing protein [Flavobacterium kingsejongi]AWG26797.1 hypothetical protein FK004_16945 [Flavobacterium kingsejongi]
MNKRNHQYRITVTHLESAKESAPIQPELQIDIENHDDIFAVIEKIQQKQLFDDPQQATEFGLGLKLFSEVLLKNRKHPLFDEFYPAFGDFMKKLKSQ